MVRCESVIEKGMATFVEVGQALAQVRDAELYRETDGTFEKYARRRWGMQKSQAYRMIESSAITRSISPRGLNAPAPSVRLDRWPRHSGAV